MKWLACLAAGLPLLATATLASAQDAPSTTPVAKSASAASEPAAKLDASAVTILPFGAHGDGASGMSAALTDSLTASLSSRKLSVHTTQVPPAAYDTSTAASSAAPGRYAVTGSVQSFGGQVRVTGQVVDASNASTVGTFQVNGPSNGFLALQDVVIAQVNQAIGAPATPVANTPQPAQAAQAEPVYTPPPSSPVLPPRGSMWGEYSELYEPAPGAAAYPAYLPYPPPQPPLPPLYGGYGINPALLGGGSFSSTGTGSDGSSFVGPLGTVRTQTFNSLGTSIIPTNPNQTTTLRQFYTTRTPATPPMAPYPASISSYRNPTIPALVGLPQVPRFSLRPGASGNPTTVTTPAPHQPSETRGGSGSSTVLRKL